VKLVVTDLNGCKDSTLRDINVYGPVASFTVVPQLQCTNQNVVFNSTSTTDGTHPITNYLWRFGDGNSINGNNAIVQNAYANPSSYLPKLIVTDSYGCVDSTLGGVVVDIIESRLGFTVTDSLSCPGGVIQFNNTSAGNNLSYTWDFGDGGSATVPNPQHSYAAPGVYTVKLIGRESIGCLDSLIKTRYITVDNPVADFTVSDTFTICPPLQVQFSNRSTYFRSLVWDFGDGNTSTNENPSYSYAIPGTYNISLTVTSPGGCTDVKTGVIKVLSNTSGSLTYSPLSGCFPVTSNFIVSANNRVQYLWDFGDGNTLFTSDSTLPYKYEFPGFYVPKVILQDEEGCLTPLIGRDTIKIFGAKAEFGLDKTVLCNNGTIQFRDSSITSDIISNITWNFGDGNSVSGIKNPVHTYTATGAYTVRLTVSTLNNCTNSKDTVVKVVPSPQVNISGNLAYCAPASINLNGNWLNPDTSSMNWAWKIDTVVARTQNLTSLILNNPNTYTTWFVATNSSGCADSSSAVITVNQVPSVDAGKDSTICLGNSLVLLPSGANNYLWTPAINLSCTNCENPSASPTDKIKYYVTGTSLENCSNTDSVTITVLKPFTITATGNDTICINQSVQLNARTADSYLWTPSTGLSNASIANPVASPLVTTTYTVTGFDQYRCFSSSADVTITVYEPPVINAGRDTTINAGSSAQLLPTLSGSISSLLWTPATGLSCTTCPNPVATPLKTTTYRLTARNPGVCISTDEVTVVVLCDKNKIFIPNAFTPNGDNLNDLFYISGTGITSVKSFRIYDRWGNKVFERTNFDANDPAFGWNGIYKSQEVAPGVFNYIAEIACSDGSTIPVQGNVTVIR
jgi:gliding motility-associated-like protein